MAKRAHFEILQKSKQKMSPVVFNEESKTGLCSEIRQRKRNCQRKPTLQSLANPAVRAHVILLTLHK